MKRVSFDIKNAAKNTPRGMSVAWVAVSYRNVLQMIAAATVLTVAALWVLFPTAAAKALNYAGRTLSHLVPGIVHASSGETGAQSPDAMIARQARFTSLDGAVTVMRKGANEWLSAGISTPLEKGDTIQTGPDGMASVMFPDGTSYTIKPGSLIVVEENSANATLQSEVAVQVAAGNVDLATGLFNQGSRSQLIVGGVTADLHSESSAAVVSGGKGSGGKANTILMKRGGAALSRHGQTLEVAANEKVSFANDTATLTKTTDIIPPVLLAPANRFSITVENGGTRFAWAPVDDARGYRLVVARDVALHNVVVTSFAPTASTTVARLAPGTYYWSVCSLDGKGRESMESERNKFVIVPEIQQASVVLTVDDPIPHGHIVEVTGKADAGARVVVNGEEVPDMDSDGAFHYFTPPLPDGFNQITVIAQSSQGMSRQVKSVLIQ